MVHPVILRIGKKFPPSVRSGIYLSALAAKAKFVGLDLRLGESSGTDEAAETLWRGRSAVGEGRHQPWFSRDPSDWPEVDITAVTYNSEQSLPEFLDSVLNLGYPLKKLALIITDNSSGDRTLALLSERIGHLRTQLRSVTVDERPNLGFGAGQNNAIAKGSAPFVLVTNVDLEFDPSALTELVRRALADPPEFASWEARQFPFEHPKYYDPVTQEVTWSSHCCVLLRRETFERVSGYDERIFLYGEDVELSYRLRREGFRLAYVPKARVLHYAFDSETRDTKRQHFGGVLSNALIRFRYGDSAARFVAPLRVMRLATRRNVSPAYRVEVLKVTGQSLRLAPKFRRSSHAAPGYPIRGWNYELERPGVRLDHGGLALPRVTPLVSIITRTVGDRPDLLTEAMATVANQTYANIEHVIIEDGGNMMRDVVDEFARRCGHAVRYQATEKLGRCGAGNAGMLAATGQFFLFLDDDDLLFADHIETLVRRMVSLPSAVAVYSQSWEAHLGPDSGRGGAEFGHQLHRLHEQEYDVDVLFHHNYMTIQSVLFSRRLFDERGGFLEELDILEDWNLWLRYSAGNRFGYVPGVTSIYRTAESNRHRERRRRSLSDAYDSVVFHNDDDVRRFRGSPIALPVFDVTRFQQG